jgi:hypothetical protein
MADLCADIDDLEDHVVAECGGEASGIVAVAFLEPEVDIDGSPDPSTATFWNALTGSSPKQAHIIKRTRGEKPKSSKVESEGFGRQKTRVTGRDHSATFEVEGIKDNRNLFNKLNKRSDLRFAMVTNGGLVYTTEKPVTIDADIENARDIDGVAFFSVEVTWSDKELVRVFDEPTGIFAD